MRIRMLKTGRIGSCLAALVLMAALAVPAADRVPALPGLAAAVRTDRTDAAAASRLGSALMHRDWMLPVESAAEAAWLAESVVRNGESGSLASPDGRRRLDWQGNLLKLVALPDGSPMAEVQTQRPWQTLQWHPAGWVVALAGTNGVEVRDGRTLALAVGEAAGAVGPTLAFSADGLHLITGRRDGGVELWDWAAVRSLAVGLPGWGTLDSAVFSPDGTRLKVRSAERSQVLDLRPGRSLSDWYGSTSSLRTVVFSPDSRRVLTASSDGVVQIRELAGDAKPLNLRLAGAPTSLDGSPDGAWLATGLTPGKVRMWRTDTGLPIGAWMAHPELTQVIAGPGGNWVWTVSPGLVRAWNVADPAGVPIPVLTNGRVHRVVADAPHRTVALLVSGTNGPVVQLRHTTNPAVVLATVPAWETTVLDLDPTGTWLLTTSTNGGLRQRSWSQGGTEPGRPDVAAGSRFLGARYSRDARHLVTVTPSGSIRVWDSSTGQPRGARIEIPGVSVEGVELSPDASRLRVEESGGIVQIYEVRSGRPASEPWWPPLRRGRPVRVEGSRFAADGSAVLVGDGDSGGRLLALPPLESAPGWLADLADTVWGVGTNGPLAGVARVRRAVESAEKKDAWTRWGDWWLSDRSQRPAAVGSSVTAGELALRHLALGNVSPLPEARRLAPNSLPVRDALVRELQTNEFWGRPYRVEQAGWLRIRP